MVKCRPARGASDLYTALPKNLSAAAPMSIDGHARSQSKAGSVHKGHRTIEVAACIMLQRHFRMRRYRRKLMVDELGVRRRRPGVMNALLTIAREPNFTLARS